MRCRGGIRGIVELEVLQGIEKALGGKLPIQCFFDLVVGTRFVILDDRKTCNYTRIHLTWPNSTGGLVALGLGAKGWSVEKCISNFERLCGGAFTKRKGHSVPLFGKVVEHFHHAKYKTQTLEEVLQDAFLNSRLLFGGQYSSDESSRSPLKTAVTATCLTEAARTYVLSTYNRPHENSEQG